MVTRFIDYLVTLYYSFLKWLENDTTILNKRNIARLIRFIQSERTNFEMSWYFNTKNNAFTNVPIEDMLKPEKKSCGFAACIGGTAALLFHPVRIKTFDELEHSQYIEIAKKSLGLTEEQGEALFCAYWYAQDLGKSLRLDALTERLPSDQRALAIEVLNRLMNATNSTQVDAIVGSDEL